jgi:hypothetical protein
MFSLILLAQAQQPQKLPWAFLVLFGLLALFAVGLLIYFLRRVRRTEKEAEEDWGPSSRGILLAPATLAEAGPEKRGGTQLDQVSLTNEPGSPVTATSGLKEAQPPVIPASAPKEPELPAVADSAQNEPAPVEPQILNETPTPLRHVEAHSVPAQPVQTVTEPGQEPAPVSQPELQPSLAEPGSPFDEEIWSELESPPQHAAANELDPVTTAGVTGLKEPYEPPRIVPIVPRQDQAQHGELPATRISGPTTASQQTPVKKARLEVRPPVSKSSKPTSAPAGSILGLPAEAAAGPFIIDRSRGREDSVAVGTLANYDKAPDEAAGHSGTIALMVVILLVSAALVTYFAIPSAHTGIDNLVARLRGIKEPPKPVAQVFPSTLDETKDPAVAKGALQNISDQTLNGLVVIVSLEPRGGGTPITQDVQVSPDEIAPAQQGTYEFQIETKKYQKYKVAGLKSRDGATLAYVKPNQQQQ